MKRQVRRTGLMAVCLIVALGLTTGISSADGGDNYHVPNVVQQFKDLAEYGDPMAFRLGAGWDPAIFPFPCKHYQGIARGHSTDGTPYLFLGISGNATESCSLLSSGNGQILIVEMGSRDKDGERLRSNRLQKDKQMKVTLPPETDVGINNIELDGQTRDSNWKLWPYYMHPGGMQLIDNVLAVALSCNCPPVASCNDNEANCSNYGESGTFID